MKRFWFVVLLLVHTIAVIIADENRLEWKDVANPRIISIQVNKDNPKNIVVNYEMDLSFNGADRASIYMINEQGLILQTKIMGKTNRPIKSVEFTPVSSGIYKFYVEATRVGENENKRSLDAIYQYELPFQSPALKILNNKNGSVLLRWDTIPEIELYEISYRLVQESSDLRNNSKSEIIQLNASGNSMEYLIKNLNVGSKYAFSLNLIKNSKIVLTKEVQKTVRDIQEREWYFTWFGQSTKSDVNTFKMIDEDSFKFSLFSCTVNSESGQIDQKGGKFTTFHDGISFYYTKTNANTENFELSATFIVDYINPQPDGQEGFGLLALDSLGEYGNNSSNHYTNSAGVIATKFEEVINGVKKTSKDTLGARFVTGLTRQIIESGDSGIAQNGRSASYAFSYDQSDLIKKGDSYRLTLKKDNTGYHAIYKKQYPGETDITEYILYDPKKLQVLDTNTIYVGFAVARGCNVTIQDVDFKITNVAEDPPGLVEPPEIIPLIAKVDSPSTYTEPLYPFIFNANANGRLTVKDRKGNALIKDAIIQANQDYIKNITLLKGNNDFIVEFIPDKTFKPGDNKVMGRYDNEKKALVESYLPYYINHSVLYHYYQGDTLFVSTMGTPFGKGTKDSPLDLSTALYFVRPGQTILLAGGVYYPTSTITIERGNNGTNRQYKIFRSVNGERAIIDFSRSNAKASGFMLSGDYWIIDSIDIRNTPGDVKGLQVAGNNNIIRFVKTYQCGDTGLQISGFSTEKSDKWPKYNQIISCESYDNKDPASNNADGFAAKLTVGKGNIFKYCIAHHNIDDGWDLFSKIETGPISPVVIENCVSYKNGSLSDGSGNGDGNGFKMGGDGIAVPHILRNSIAYCNGTSGITSNSNPAIIIENCTAYANKGANINLYGKGDSIRSFIVKNSISLQGGISDVYREMPEIESRTNFLWNGAMAKNSEGQQINLDIFTTVDCTLNPEIQKDGKINIKGLFQINKKELQGLGAQF
ncbi:right-handed parallel beta-helix repeat-containing protein [Gracilinema caldarium]|uniref:Pectate disaccharide-lyase n=1 Tax=Gracilinema caldarium (strain ATCC 51460 / DSM 7334 / H1) TaxID=744872 RepID=F8F1E9_GRAC1|nr:pectate disaccharide-lyase [Gracilinema caldarium]AEJ18793.1 Pectate disaccharide-lyase [Gracilinema caldarium DSM 7334]